MLKKLKFLNLKVQSRTKKMSYIKTVACAKGTRVNYKYMSNPAAMFYMQDCLVLYAGFD